MFEGADYYIRHNDSEEQEPETPVDFKTMPLSKFAEFASKAARNSTDQVNDTIARADSFAFQIVHPEYLPTAENKRLIDHWLTVQGIDNPTYPDFEAAFNRYKDTGLLDLDAAELARDQRGRTYIGVFTKQKFHSVDELIAAERHAALAQVTPISAEEKAFDSLPADEALNLLREAERAAQQQIDSAAVQDAADAWLLLRPEWHDSTRNGKLMRAQLLTNGVVTATIPDLEKAAQQLRDSGLVTLNQKQVEKQHAKQLQQRAGEAAKQLFDQTTEQEMYDLPLDEVRRRASNNWTGVGI